MPVTQFSHFLTQTAISLLHNMHNQSDTLNSLMGQELNASATGQRSTTHMGSAALGEAIKTIRDWSMTEGRNAKKPARVSDVFGSLVFNDQVLQARLPKAVYRALRATIQEGHPLDP